MTQEQLDRELSEISDSELHEKVMELLSKLCKTGGKAFTMSVPVKSDDTDMLIGELLKRFKQKNNNKNV